MELLHEDESKENNEEGEANDEVDEKNKDDTRNGRWSGD